MKVKPPIDPIDAHVGEKLRLARALRGLSQEKLAAFESLTFQQMQKYEKGSNRISTSRLYHLATHLRMPIPWFFEGLPDPSGGDEGYADSSVMDIPGDRETHRLLGLFHSVDDRKKRKVLLGVIQSVVELMG